MGNQTENNPAFDLVCGGVLIQAFLILRDQILQLCNINSGKYFLFFFSKTVEILHSHYKISNQECVLDVFWLVFFVFLFCRGPLCW